MRGKLTRDLLIKNGFDVPCVYGDPALLLNKFYNPTVEKKYKLGIIPHKVDYRYVKSLINDDSVNIIDLLPTETNTIFDITNEILKCEYTVSSALHGLIVSHTYGIPSVWVELSNGVFGNGFKFADYFSSVNISPYRYKLTKDEVNSEYLLSLAKTDSINKIVSFDNELLINAFPHKMFQ